SDSAAGISTLTAVCGKNEIPMSTAPMRASPIAMVIGNIDAIMLNVFDWENRNAPRIIDAMPEITLTMNAAFNFICSLQRAGIFAYFVMTGKLAIATRKRSAQ